MKYKTCLSIWHGVFVSAVSCCTVSGTGILLASADLHIHVGPHLAGTRHAGTCVAFNPIFKQKAEDFTKRLEKGMIRKPQKKWLDLRKVEGWWYR